MSGTTLTAPSSEPLLSRLGMWATARGLTMDMRGAIDVAKVVLAALLALLISLVLDLSSPRTAMFCVFLVMQARSGLVFQKSYYRLIGTVVGATVSVILIGAFAQTPELFFIGLGLWVGLCTAGSFVFRNFRSYGFVLAGYTVCFVALPTINAPSHVFDVAVTRVIEMFVGVLCAAVVSDTVFPLRLADEVRSALRRRFQDFSMVLRDAPQTLAGGDTGKAAMLRFAGDALGLDANHANAALESSDLRRQRLHLQLLNHEFMGVTTTLHSFHQLLRRLQAAAEPEVLAALMALYRPFSAQFNAAPDNTADAHGVLQRLAGWEQTKAEQLAQLRANLPPHLDATERLDFDTGVELFERLVQEFRAYCSTQARFDSPAALTPETLAHYRAVADELRFSTRTDPLLALLAGLRGIAVMATTGGFWLASGWNWGTGPMMNGIASGTVFASQPAPAQMLRQALIGWALAVPLGLVWNFLLIPRASDWLGLCLLLMPALALIAWLAQSPRWGAIGAGMYISFMLHTSLDRSFNANLPDFLEGCFADFIGFATAYTFYVLIDANVGPWGRRRIVSALRRQLVDICQGHDHLRREALESASRDLVQRIATRGHLADATDHWVFDWLLTVLEIGRAVIDLRASMDNQPPAQLPLALPLALQRLGALFDAPSPTRRQQAVQAVESAIAALLDRVDNAAPGVPGAVRRALILDLHFIRSALLDSASVLDGRGH